MAATKVKEGQLSSGLLSGWILDTDTWTYASATTFTISGKNVTAKFPKGTKIKLTNSTVKYFYVVGSAFSTDTTITVTGGSDYTLEDEAITSPYYSYASTPQGFPHIFAYTSTPGGFSENPTVLAYFRLVGTTCFVNIRIATATTSNANTFTLTAPITSGTNTVHMNEANGTDNGSYTGGVTLSISTNTTTIQCLKDGIVTGWTASGTKRVNGQLFYEIA